MKMPFPLRRWFVPAPSPESLIVKPKRASSSVAYELEIEDPHIGSRPRILITALDSTNPRIAETINSTTSIAFMDGLFPIVVGTGLSTDFLVNAPMPVELLPKSSDLKFLSDLEYAQYIDQRWKIILGKWEIAEVLDLAKDISGFVAGQMAVVGEETDSDATM